MGEELHLIVTDPPQPEKFDVNACAECFNQPVYETKVRLGFPAPEILFSDANYDDHALLLEALTQAGVKAFSLSGTLLDLLPPHAPVERFEVHDDRIDWYVRGEKIALPNQSEVFMVSCRPAVEGIPPDRLTAANKKIRLKNDLMFANGRQRQGRFETYAGAVERARRMRKEAAKALDSHVAESAAKDQKYQAQLRNQPDFKELWYIHDQRIQRISLSGKFGTDFSGLGAARSPGQLENVNNTIKLVESRCTITAHDTRLVGLHFRTAPVADRHWKDVIAECIDGGAAPYDVASRLCYLSKNREALDKWLAGPGDAAPPPAPLSEPLPSATAIRRARKSFE